MRSDWYEELPATAPAPETCPPCDDPETAAQLLALDRETRTPG